MARAAKKTISLDSARIHQLKVTLKWSKPPIWRRLQVRGDKIAQEGGTFRYEYDFGDSWVHEIKVEKVLAPEPGTRYPRCLDGKPACPPEDCGGVPGYERMLGILADPEDEEHEEIAEWLGEDFDPEAFDLGAVNEELAEVR